MKRQLLRCPVTGNPIVIDAAALAHPNPVRFICPSCKRTHKFDGQSWSIINGEPEERDKPGDPGS
jgi:hypothetical protein